MAVEGLANIKLMSDELVGRWNDSVAKLPILQLDYTWTSIRVLDLMSVEIS